MKRKLFAGLFTTGLLILLLGAAAVETVDRLIIAPMVVSSWSELLDKYLNFRFQMGPIVPPSVSCDDVAEKMGKGDWSFLAENWQFKFQGGSYFLAEDSPLSKGLKLPLHILIYEDIQRGEIVVLSSKDGERYKGEALFDAPEFLDPDFSSALTPEEKAEEEHVYFFEELSPRRIIWEFTLKPEEDAWNELVLQRGAAAASMSLLEEGGAMAMMSVPAEHTNDMWISGEVVSNGLDVAVYCPAGVSNVEIYVSDNLISNIWTVAAENLSAENTNTVAWFTPIDDVGFFRAGNADLDSDSDDLCDARERIVYKTDPDDADTDNDGINDGVEILAGTDPLDPDNYRVTVMGSTTNGTPFKGALGVSCGFQQSGHNPLVSTNLSVGNGFEFENLVINSPSNLLVHLFFDVNTNGLLDASELFISKTLSVTGETSAIQMKLSLNTCDGDHDHILDFWEQQCGLSWTNKEDAYEDPDSDGLYNLHEYWADTGVMVSNSNYAISDAMFAVDHAIAGLNPTNSLDIFSVQDHANTNYVRNTNCWAASYDLTCLSPWNSRLSNIGAGTLISPQHILFCAHFSNPPRANDILRFVDQQNNAIERQLLAIKTHPDYSPYYPDIIIGGLDAPVPTNSITFAKVLPDDFRDYIGSGERIPALRLDQEEKALIGDVSYISAESAILSTKCMYPPDPGRLQYYETVILGDSGNPALLIINQEPVLLTVWTYGGAGKGTSVTAFKEDINQLMSDLDAQCGITNGYQLTEINLTGFDQLD